MSVSDKILELRTHREAIRQAINDKGVELAEGSPMSDYAGAINEIGGGEIDYTKINGIVRELQFNNGSVSLVYVDSGTLILPQEPHVISNGFLQDNTSIKTLVNTEYVTVIEDSAFNGSNITGEYDFSNVTEIGRYAFSRSNIYGDLSFPKLTALVNSTSNIGGYFYKTQITSIDLPLLEILPYETFSECRSLKFINIPNVKTIHYRTFSYVSNCETIILGEIIPIIEGGTSFRFFLTSSMAPNCKIQVPPHRVSAYKADTFWSQYADRIVPYP